MSNRGDGALVTILVAVVIYLGIWLWCKLTGEKPEMES